MFETKKCIGHAVGGAVVGVAVGMAIHKYLSPHSSQRPSAIAEIPSSRACAYEKKRSRSEHLEIPKTHEKNKNCRSCSKSPCEKSKSRQPKIHCSRVSSNSSDKSSSKSNLINLSSCSKNREKAKTEKTSKIFNNDQSCEKREKHLKLSIDDSTEYLPLKCKKDKNSFPNPSFSCNEKNEKSHSSNETNEKSTCSKWIEDLNNSEDSILVKDSKHSSVDLKKNIVPSEENIESAIATCDTFDHRSSLDFIQEMSCFSDAKFLTLPVFNASSVVSSTEYLENE